MPLCTMPIRILTVLLALVVSFAPIASTVTPAEAAVTELDAVLRLVPAVAGAMGGFCLGSSLGIVGKVGGAYIGWELGKLIGTFLSHTISGVFYDSYPAQPPLWKRLLGMGGSSYGYGSYGYSGSTPWAPVSSDGSLGQLRDTWLESVKSYEDALKNGDAAAKQARRTTLEAAEKAYFSAKGAPAK